MRKSFKQTLIVAAIAATVGFVSAERAVATPMNANAKKMVKKSSDLMVLSAADGVITKSGNQYTLTLSHVNPKVMWFTDRPERKAGFIPTKEFVAKWSKGFKSSESNAALVHINASADVNGQTQPMAMEIMQPKYKENDLVIPVKVLKGDKIVLGKLDDMSLFIDVEINKFYWFY